MKKMKKNKEMNTIKRTGGERIVYTIVFALFLVYAVSLILPLLWMLMNSFKEGTEYALDVVGANTIRLPSQILFFNYTDVFPKIIYNGVDFLGMLFNSLIYIVIGNGASLFFTVCVDYVISKYDFKGKNFIYAVAIFAMMLPIIGSSAASVKLRADLGLYDNLLALIVTAGAGAFGFNFLMLYGFFKNVSRGYMEAAFIDGASHFKVFFRVMLPQATPMLGTLFILSAIGSWNDYTTPMLYFPNYPNLAMGLYLVSNELTRGDMPTYFAALVITTIPILILFCCFSDTIMKNYSVGGLKG